jgi:outer membrane receptor protein involved in Fe transport
MVTRFSVFVLLTSSFVLSSFLAPAPASAQPPQARAEGRVVDTQQRAVPRAVVVFTSLVGAPQSITTNEDGHFAVVGLAEGRYDVTASVPGLFGESRGVTLTANQLTTIDVTLHLSAITEALVVSAAHTDLPLSRAADSVTVISGAEIASRQLTSVGDALAGLPGFTVAHSGGPGTLTSVFPRGGESDYTLVLVDGVRANAFGGGLDLSQVQLTDVERVEVVRGPQSALFGSDAIGGVVQVITRQGGPPSVTGKIETGSRDTRRAAVATSGERSSWKWNGGADYFSEDGFTDAAPANGELVSNDDAREAQVWVGGGRRFTRGTDVGGSLRYLETERGAPGPYGSDPAGRFFGVDQISRGDTARRSVGFRAMHPWFGPASRIRQRVEIDHADYDLTFLSSFDPDNPSESETRRVHARVQTDAVLDAGFSVSGGFEWLGERASSSFITAGTEEVPVKRSVLGFFGEGRWNGVERIALQAGVRGERITRNVLPGNDALSDADTVLSVNPKVAVSYLVSSPGRACARRPALAFVRLTHSRSRSPTIPRSSLNAAAASMPASHKRSLGDVCNSMGPPSSTITTT